MAQARHRRKSMWDKIWGSVAAVVVALPLVAVPVSTAAAEEQGLLTVKKSASVTEVVPGQTFTYTIEIGCTTFGAGCTNATLSDQVPDGLIVVGTPTLGGTTTGDVTVDGNQVGVVFTNPLAGPGRFHQDARRVHGDRHGHRPGRPRPALLGERRADRQHRDRGRHQHRPGHRERDRDPHRASGPRDHRDQVDRSRVGPGGPWHCPSPRPSARRARPTRRSTRSRSPTRPTPPRPPTRSSTSPSRASGQ